MQSLRVRMGFICIDGHEKHAHNILTERKAGYKRMYLVGDLYEASDSDQ